MHTVDRLPTASPGGPLVVEPGADGAATVAAPVLQAPQRARQLALDLLRLIRPQQWPKNLLVVPLALLDAPGLSLAGLTRLAWAVVVFTLASAVVYVWNDALDRHRDRAHPVKRDRPIASGRVGLPLAVAYGTALALALLVATVSVPQVPWWPLVAYLLLNIAYSRWLKYVPLVDVFVVAAGFVLRALQGSVAAGTDVSHWLLITVFALCLLMILGKRRNEMAVSGAEHRPALRAYSPQYLEYLLVLCAALAVCAMLFFLSDGGLAPDNDLAMLVSVPFATFGLARYLQVVVVQREGGDPVRVLLRDRMMLATAALWAGLLALVVLLARFPELTGVFAQ